MATNPLPFLRERGLIDAVSSQELDDYLSTPRTVYCGFDPTADSLHLGNMLAIMMLAHFQNHGHHAVALIGGATALIGDPSGKSHERPQLEVDLVEKNIVGIRKNLEAILDCNHSSVPARILNNYDWYKGASYITFLRDVGKYFRMGPMLAKDSVKTRLQSEEGMSYTEFSYQVLQGFDFLHLCENEDVTIQVGGSDQWGNMTAGTDLIRKVTGKPAFVLTSPLLTQSNGKKFGKSETGAVWLSPDRLSSYDLYQYLYSVPDSDVIKLLKALTFIDIKEITTLEESMNSSDYKPNTAQKRLAEEVTRILHGDEGVANALRVTQAAAPGADTVLDAETLLALGKDMPSQTLVRQDVESKTILELLVATKLVASKGEARRLVRNGGVYLNNHRIEEESYTLQGADLIENKLLLLALGKKRKLLVKIDAE